MSLRAIIEVLVGEARTNREKAYAVLGAEPGPGIDILIKPATDQLSGEWKVFGMSKAGTTFVRKFWQFQPINNQQLATMKRQAMEWDMKFETQLPSSPLDRELGDPL